MRKLFFVAVAAILVSFSASAQDTYRYFKKGLAFNANIGSSYLFDKNDMLVKNEDGKVVNNFKSPTYLVDLDLALGYRFRPEISIYGGIGGDISLNTSLTNFSLPLFVRVRSDFMDTKVAPFVALDLGYNIYFKDAIGGAKSVESLKKETIENGEKFSYKDDKNYKSETLYMFTSSAEDGNIEIQPDGVFSKLQFGVSWKAGACRLDVAAFVNIQECHRGLLVPTNSDFGLISLSHLNKQEEWADGVPVFSGLMREVQVIKNGGKIKDSVSEYRGSLSGKEVTADIQQQFKDQFIQRLHCSVGLKFGVAF